MSDYSITAANFQPSADAKRRTVTLGAAATAGQPLYRDAATNTYKPARANASATAKCAGIAESSGADGQQIRMVTEDPALELGATLTKGDIVCVSQATAGGLCEEADITTGGYKTVIAIATSTTVVDLNCTERFEVGSAL